jgi:hypothetical protein
MGVFPALCAERHAGHWNGPLVHPTGHLGVVGREPRCTAMSVAHTVRPVSGDPAAPGPRGRAVPDGSRFDHVDRSAKVRFLPGRLFEAGSIDVLTDPPSIAARAATVQVWNRDPPTCDMRRGHGHTDLVRSADRAFSHCKPTLRDAPCSPLCAAPLRRRLGRSSPKQTSATDRVTMTDA